jgi:hypothetical protein
MAQLVFLFRRRFLLFVDISTASGPHHGTVGDQSR